MEKKEKKKNGLLIFPNIITEQWGYYQDKIWIKLEKHFVQILSSFYRNFIHMILEKLLLHTWIKLG